MEESFTEFDAEIRRHEMLSKLMRTGEYCVNYLEQGAKGFPFGFGFYVCEELRIGTVYSKAVKRLLYRGLCVIQAELGWENLVGIYVDVCDGKDLSRPSLRQLKADVRSGLFSRVLIAYPQDIPGKSDIDQEFDELSRQVEGFELMDLIAYRLSV